MTLALCRRPCVARPVSPRANPAGRLPLLPRRTQSVFPSPFFDVSIGLSIGLFFVGLGLVIAAAEALVESTLGTAARLGRSAFLISTVFIGFDPENLAVGIAGTVEASAGIALGTILGSAMVAVALAFGVTAVLAPLRFEAVPQAVLVVPVGAAALFGGLCLDGCLSRLDGALLLGGYVAAVGVLLWQEHLGRAVAPTEAVAAAAEEDAETRGGRAIVRFVLCLAGIVVGSELVVRSSTALLPVLGLSDTTFGMTILALLVSLEEVARELPAAWTGRPDITIGNVIGSVLAFFLFNAGIIALVRPVPVSDTILNAYLPLGLGTVVFISAVLWRGRVPRWAGGVLVLLYLLFVAAGTGGLASVSDGLVPG